MRRIIALLFMLLIVGCSDRDSMKDVAESCDNFHRITGYWSYVFGWSKETRTVCIMKDEVIERVKKGVK